MVPEIVKLARVAFAVQEPQSAYLPVGEHTRELRGLYELLGKELFLALVHGIIPAQEFNCMANAWKLPHWGTPRPAAHHAALRKLNHAVAAARATTPRRALSFIEHMHGCHDHYPIEFDQIRAVGARSAGAEGVLHELVHAFLLGLDPDSEEIAGTLETWDSDAAQQHELQTLRGQLTILRHHDMLTDVDAYRRAVGYPQLQEGPYLDLDAWIRSL